MPANRVTLRARLLKTEALRRTPAGVASLQVVLQHSSMQIEAQHERQVSCEVEAVAFGSIAERLAQELPGAALQVEGFLDRKSMRQPALIVHLTEFEFVKE